MNQRPEVVRQALDALLVARNLERVADHATNIAEDVIFWVQGADVRHNVGAVEEHPEPAPGHEGSTRASGV
jgi:phosphate transport system protein